MDLEEVLASPRKTCSESIDAAADCHSLGKFIRGQSNEHRRMDEDANEDLRPVAHVRFNTRVRKPKPVTVKAPLDSGGGGTLVTESVARKLKVKQTRTEQVWTTPGGALETSAKVKAQFTVPELHNKSLIEWGTRMSLPVWVPMI